MATGILLEFNGVTAKEYDRVIESLRLDQYPPKGRLLHTAGPTSNGWLVFNIFESRNDYEQYYNDRVLPVFKQLGMPNPIRVEYVPIHNAFVPNASALGMIGTTVSTR